MSLLHLSFSGSLKPHQLPPAPPTAEERLRAFRAAYPAMPGNLHAWKWLDDPATNRRDAELNARRLPSIKAARLARDMLQRLSGDHPQAASANAGSPAASTPRMAA